MSDWTTPDKIRAAEAANRAGFGRTDCRCWTFTDLREALIAVAAAGAPPA